MVKFAAVVLIGVWFVMGCGQTEERIQREPDLVLIGVTPDYPPFEFVDSATGNPDGFDIELITLICQANRWRYRIVPTRFNELLSSLSRGELDIAISAITVTPEREAIVAFSDPYYLTGQALVVPRADSITVSLADLQGKRTGVVTGTSGEELVRRIDGLLLFPYDDIATALSDLASGELDAVINDRPTTRELLKTIGGLKVLPGTLNSEYYAIAMRIEDTERLAKLNDALAGLMGGYAYERLHAQWFGYPPMEIEAPDSVAAQWPAD